MDRTTVQLAATAVGLAATVYGAVLPDLATVRNGQGGASLNQSMAHAALASVAAVLVLALTAGSATVAVVGGSAVVGLAAAYRDAATVGAR